MDGNRCVGAVGFSTRENKFYVFKAKAVICGMGGAVHVFRPRSVGEGFGRSWYPPFNSASSAYFTIKAGAEMTCQEVRFIPVRFKDAYGSDSLPEQYGTYIAGKFNRSLEVAKLSFTSAFLSNCHSVSKSWRFRPLCRPHQLRDCIAASTGGRSR